MVPTGFQFPIPRQLKQTKENPSNRDPDSVVEDRQRRVQYNGQQAVHDNGHGPTRYG